MGHGESRGVDAAGMAAGGSHRDSIGTPRQHYIRTAVAAGHRRSGILREQQCVACRQCDAQHRAPGDAQSRHDRSALDCEPESGVGIQRAGPGQRTDFAKAVAGGDTRRNSEALDHANCRQRGSDDAGLGDARIGGSTPRCKLDVLRPGSP